MIHFQKMPSSTPLGWQLKRAVMICWLRGIPNAFSSIIKTIQILTLYFTEESLEEAIIQCFSMFLASLLFRILQWPLEAI